MVWVAGSSTCRYLQHTRDEQVHVVLFAPSHKATAARHTPRDKVACADRPKDTCEATEALWLSQTQKHTHLALRPRIATRRSWSPIPSSSLTDRCLEHNAHDTAASNSHPPGISDSKLLIGTRG